MAKMFWLGLPGLEKRELDLLVEIANADARPPMSESQFDWLCKKRGLSRRAAAKEKSKWRDELERSTRPLRQLEKEVEQYMSRSSYVGARFQEQSRVEAASLRGRWRIVQIFLRPVIKDRGKPGWYCYLPAIGLPLKKHLVSISTPRDLVNWLIARAAAHGQLLRLVFCVRHKRFALRERGRIDSKYCSRECQRQADKEQRTKRYAGTRQLGTLARDKLRAGQIERLAVKLGGKGHLADTVAREYGQISLRRENRK